jgi:hypothetical protein
MQTSSFMSFSRMLSSFELIYFIVGSFTAKLLSWVASRILDPAVSFRFAGFQRVKDVSIQFRKVKNSLFLFDWNYWPVYVGSVQLRDVIRGGSNWLCSSRRLFLIILIYAGWNCILGCWRGAIQFSQAALCIVAGLQISTLRVRCGDCVAKACGFDKEEIRSIASTSFQIPTMWVLSSFSEAICIRKLSFWLSTKGAGLKPWD